MIVCSWFNLVLLELIYTPVQQNYPTLTARVSSGPISHGYSLTTVPNKSQVTSHTNKYVSVTYVIQHGQ